MQKLLFLDIDGVLHKLNAYRTNEGFLEYKDFLFNVIGEIPVVISSSWRITYTLDELQNMLWPLNVISSTDVDREDMSSCSRQMEIEQWIADNKMFSEADYRALDDMSELFKRDCNWLILCDNNQGFVPRSRAYKQIKEWVNG